MEITRLAAKRQFCSRLLGFLFFCLLVFPVQAEKLTNRKIKKLTIEPVNESVFVQQDAAFILTLPGIAPENVQASVPKTTDSVQYISSRRSDFIDADRDIGTRIEFWFSFMQAGMITLTPLTVTVNGYRYSIPFSPILVNENPETVLPKMSIHFDSGVIEEKDGSFTAVAGKPVTFTVYLKFILQIAKFDWELQKNSLFSELKRYSITEGKPRGRDYFSEEVPVASFEWRPLTTGEWTVPAIKIIAAKYNGSRVEVEMPYYKVNVVENAEKQVASNEPANDGVFAYAFTESEVPVQENFTKSLNAEECKKLAELRIQERNSLPLSKKRAERFEYEKAFGINSDVPEPSLPVFYVLLGFAGIFTALTVIFIINKKKIFILFLSLLSVVILLAMMSGSKLHAVYAIFAGGGLSPVPEELQLSQQEENGGMRVEVLEQTSKWAYVVFNGTGGWVMKDRVFLIK